MAHSESFQGFVPITIFIAGLRIEGKVWKEADCRLLQHIEQNKRQFLPVVDVLIFDLANTDAPPQSLPVLAVNLRTVHAILPGDSITPVSEHHKPVPAEVNQFKAPGNGDCI